MREQKSGRAGGRKPFCTGTRPPARSLRRPVAGKLLPRQSRSQTGVNEGAQRRGRGDPAGGNPSSGLDGDFDRQARAHIVKDALQIFQWPVGANQQFKAHSTAGEQ